LAITFESQTLAAASQGL